jgi:hypothetical protein
MDFSKEFENNKKRIKVAIAIPHMGHTVAGMETKIAQWIRESNYDIIQTFRSVNPTYANRNLLVKDFLESDADFLLQLDSDTVPLSNPLKMVEHDKDIVGGVYPAWKEKGYVWLAVNKAEDGSFKQLPPEKQKGLVECDALGTGCLLVKRGVLENMKTPFIDKVNPEVGDRALGHDLYFCERAKEMGYRVWADWDVICDHAKEVPLLAVVNAMQDAYKRGFETGKKEQ